MGRRVEETDYRCAYRISGLGEEPRERSAFGVDSLQALTLSRWRPSLPARPRTLMMGGAREASPSLR